MPTREDWDKLSSKELHDHAMELAKHRLDAGFLWRLLKMIPAAEAASGDVGDAEADVLHISGKIHDLMHADEGGLADALRPVYIDYLDEHQGDAASWKSE
jgi:hypothetical protein